MMQSIKTCLSIFFVTLLCSNDVFAVCYPFQRARDIGYNDTQIIEHLRRDPKYLVKFYFSGARLAGATDTQIINFLITNLKETKEDVTCIDSFADGSGNSLPLSPPRSSYVPFLGKNYFRFDKSGTKLIGFDISEARAQGIADAEILKFLRESCASLDVDLCLSFFDILHTTESTKNSTLVEKLTAISDKELAQDKDKESKDPTAKLAAANPSSSEDKNNGIAPRQVKKLIETMLIVESSLVARLVFAIGLFFVLSFGVLSQDKDTNFRCARWVAAILASVSTLNANVNQMGINYFAGALVQVFVAYAIGFCVGYAWRKFNPIRSRQTTLDGGASVVNLRTPALETSSHMNEQEIVQLNKAFKSQSVFRQNTNMKLTKKQIIVCAVVIISTLIYVPVHFCTSSKCFEDGHEILFQISDGYSINLTLLIIQVIIGLVVSTAYVLFTKAK